MKKFKLSKVILFILLSVLAILSFSLGLITFCEQSSVTGDLVFLMLCCAALFWSLFITIDNHFTAELCLENLKSDIAFKFISIYEWKEKYYCLIRRLESDNDPPRFILLYKNDFKSESDIPSKDKVSEFDVYSKNEGQILKLKLNSKN